MPIAGPTLLRSLDQKDFGELDYCVMRHAFACHNQLGRLCDEVIYQNDLATRLQAAGIPVTKEVKVELTYHDFTKTYWLDLVVANAWIYELKTHRMLVGEHDAQLLNYLFVCESNHGKLINFRAKQVESKFVNTTLTLEQRRVIEVDTERWQEWSERDGFFRETMLGLLEDWGSWLDLALYTEAICHFLGGEERIVKPVALARDGVMLGNQRLHLLTPDTAFRLTALTEGTEDYEQSLLSLLRVSSLRAIQWVNLARRRVQFMSLVK
jgi:GxxExxY protein